jgi:hypothetical protein
MSDVTQLLSAIDAGDAQAASNTINVGGNLCQNG